MEAASTVPASAPLWRTRVRAILLLVVLVSSFVVAKIMGWESKLDQLRTWIQTLGPWGPLAFIALFILVGTAALPVSPMTLLAGAIFGPVIGTICASAGAAGASASSFLISRYMARDAVSRWLAGNSQYQRLEKLVAQRGAFIVAVSRVVPIPFCIVNYGLALTRVGFWTFVFWSWLVMLPGLAMAAVGIDAVIQGMREGHVNPTSIAILVTLFFLIGGMIFAGWCMFQRDDADKSE